MSRHSNFSSLVVLGLYYYPPPNSADVSTQPSCYLCSIVGSGVMSWLKLVYSSNSSSSFSGYNSIYSKLEILLSSSSFYIPCFDRAVKENLSSYCKERTVIKASDVSSSSWTVFSTITSEIWVFWASTIFWLTSKCFKISIEDSRSKPESYMKATLIDSILSFTALWFCWSSS